MNNLQLSSVAATMSSREIAELTGKEHRNVLADCDKLNESYRDLGLAEISAGVYIHPSTGSQQHRECLLTRMQCLDLLTGYRIDLRIKVNRRWEELETRAQTIDFSSPETVLMLAQNWKEEMDRRLAAEAESERLTIANEEANQTIKIQAPKVKAFEEMINSEGLVSTTQIAMEHGISAIALNRKLCALGVQYKQGDTYILYAKYKDKDFATLRSKPGGVDQYGNTVMRMHLYWTQRGRVFIHNLLTA